MGQGQWGGRWRWGRGGHPVFIVSRAIIGERGDATRAYSEVGVLAYPGQGTNGKGAGDIFPQEFPETDWAVQPPDAVAMPVDVYEGFKGVGHEVVPPDPEGGRARRM